MGGTMRLGLYDCEIKKGTLADKCYGEKLIKERHRHRYEFNNQFKEAYEKAGMVFSGVNPQSGLCEIIELPSNDFFIASQFHPEFTSRPLRPNPLFKGFIGAAIKHQDK
jgi:CTP synthase